MESSLLSVTMLAINAIMYSLYYFYIFVLNRNRYLAYWGFGWIAYSLGYLFVLSTSEETLSLIFKYSFSLFSSILLLIGTYSFVEKKIPPKLLNSVFLLICIVVIVSIIIPHNPTAINILSLSTSVILMTISVVSGLAFLIIKNNSKNILREITGWAFIVWGIHKGFYPFVSPDFYYSDVNYMTSIVLINAVNMAMILCFLNQNNKLIIDQEVRFRKLAEASEKKHAELEMSRQKLLANISHELRTPITSIIGNLSIITDGLEDDKKRIKEYANISLQKSLTLNSLIQDLFELSTKEAMQMRFDREKLSVDDLMSILKKKISVDTKKNNVVLKIQGACKKSMRNCPYIFADPLRMEQVIQNMVNNGAKHISQAGRIHIGCCCHNFDTDVDPDFVQIKVKDTGTGIAAEYIPHIFEMFYKGPDIDNNQGSGLGLALSKDIVNYHNGDIEVKSELGIGTEFIISLPLDKERGDLND